MEWNKYSQYIIFDEPVPYWKPNENLAKDKPLLIYPVRLKDIFKFNYFSTCLLEDKNSIPDAAIISMGYLEYMYYATVKDFDKTPYIPMFRELLKLCLHKQSEQEAKSIGFNIRFERPFIFSVDGKVYDEQDFQEIRRIICDQNLLELPDDSAFGKDLRDRLEEARRIKAKMSEIKMCSFEDQMAALSIFMGVKIEDIYNMTLRKYRKSLERADHTINYIVMALLSPYRETKDTKNNPVLPWLADLTKKEYADVLMPVDELERDVNKVNGSH